MANSPVADEFRKQRMLKFLKSNRDTPGDTSDYIDEESTELAEAEALCQEIKAAMIQISNIWTEIGLFGPHRANRRNEWLNSFRELNQHYLGAESECARLMKKEEKEYLTQINSLSQELKLEPWTPPSGQTLIFTVNKLIDRFEELQAIKQERLEKWSQMDKEHALCAGLLGANTRSVTPSSDVPTEMDIQTLQTKVLELRATLARRKKEYAAIKVKVTQLLDLLELSPDSEEARFYFDEGKLVYSDSFLKSFEKYSTSLQTKYNEDMALREQLVRKLEELWDKLEISHEERTEQLYNLEGCKPSQLKQLKGLLVKYEELKRQNIGKFIEKIRGEIVDYWNRCYVSHDDRDSFRVYLNQTDYDEPLLTAHEQELERWKTFYEINKTLFESFEKWQDSWVKLLELEEQCNDPNRFNNRGGVLLKQEKEKKRLQKDLQKCEKDIRILAEKWSATNGGFFMIDGLYVLDFMSRQKLLHQEFKENEKFLKKTKEQEHKLAGSSVRASPMFRVKPSSAAKGSNALLPQKKAQDGALTGSARKRVGTSSNKSRPESAKIPRLRTPVDSFLACRATRSKKLFGQTPRDNVLEAPESRILNSTFQKTETPHTFRVYGELNRRQSKSYPSVSGPNIDDLSLSPVRISQEV